jgi:hypothetical protein
VLHHAAAAQQYTTWVLARHPRCSTGAYDATHLLTAALCATLQAISVGVGFACFAAAAVVTGSLIPASMRPRFAWPLASEWLVFSFCMLLAAWFTVCRFCGSCT